jgi:excisionase family DNA binding protein
MRRQLERAYGMNQTANEFLTVKEAAALLRVSQRTLFILSQPQRADGIPTLRLGKRVLYPRRALEEWIQKRMAVGIQGAIPQTGQ